LVKKDNIPLEKEEQLFAFYGNNKNAKKIIFIVIINVLSITSI
jgi:hypothetical protein